MCRSFAEIGERHLLVECSHDALMSYTWDWADKHTEGFAQNILTPRSLFFLENK